MLLGLALQALFRALTAKMANDLAGNEMHSNGYNPSRRHVIAHVLAHQPQAACWSQADVVALSHFAAAAVNFQDEAHTATWDGVGDEAEFLAACPPSQGTFQLQAEVHCNLLSDGQVSVFPLLSLACPKGNTSHLLLQCCMAPHQVTHIV